MGENNVIIDEEIKQVPMRNTPGKSSNTEHSWHIPLAIAFICALLVIWFTNTRIGKLLEYKTYDWRTALRNREIFTDFQAETHYRNPDIIIVPVDDKTLDSINDPLVFWGPIWNKVFNALIANDVKVIGLDYIFKVSFDEYTNKQLEEISLAMKNSDEGDDCLAIIEQFKTNYDFQFLRAIQSGKIVLSVMSDKQGKINKPFRSFYLVATHVPPPPGRESKMRNVGIINTKPDFDRIARRQFLLMSSNYDSTFKNYYFIHGINGIVPIIFEEYRGGQEEFFNFDLVLASRTLGKPVINTDNRFFLGEAAIPHNRKFEFIINYIGDTGTFVGKHSLVDLYEKALEGDNEFFRKNFAGKSVLIGPGYTGSTDLVNTPYDILGGLEMYGIEVHANQLNTLINQDFIRQNAKLQEFLVILALALIMGYISYYKTPGFSFFLGLIIGILYTIISFFVLYKYNFWINLASPLLVLPIVFGTVYAYRFIIEGREKRFIRKVLGRYVSEQVAQEILKDPSKLALGGTRTEVSVLFCDINDFTTYSETTPPEDIIAIINDYFTRMERVIFKHNGTLKQFVGDEIMVITGAPQPNPKHAEQICNIAVDMYAELKKWQKERKELGLYAFDAKFGIHSGEVVAGNVGSPNRTEYSTIGDVVNTTARIMDLTKKAGAFVLISGATYQQVKDKFEVRDKGAYPVKGRDQEVKVYELIGRKNENEE
ncbi:MAG: CHASE2 domain-containing protein [Vulcanimicrobiota bacterium]